MSVQSFSENRAITKYSSKKIKLGGIFGELVNSKKIKYVKIDPTKLIGKKIIDKKWPALKGYTAPQAGEVSED